MKKRFTEHTTIRNGKLFCMNCGRDQDMHLPIEVEMASAMMIAFAKIHKKCAPTWKEPEVDLTKSENARAEWWFANGQRGSSSEAIYYCLTGKGYRRDHPYDPDDFSRCYKLLQVVPEWKTQLQKVKHLSPAWSNLIDNWDRLTEMYEENQRTEWKKAKEIGMYALMQTLIEVKK